MNKLRLTHLDSQGAARMVDVGQKPVQARRAVAEGVLRCAPATIKLLRQQGLPKGDALAVARIAGIQAAKRTTELIPLCHPLRLNEVGVDFEVRKDRIVIRSVAATDARTGVEMEALTGVAVAGLALYDMLKSVDKKMSLQRVRLISKTKK
ncbi:MAG TPA: cyclic pyranopterin monophosphate synthase MoaC [Opitutales bacterium]|jgi:cyclic pyranopterin phosphate synthase|nr:cyclic pyranopterin monophosphate synthase MoaC [Opitutales bacterium]